MTKTLIIGAAIIILGWAGWAVLAPRDADTGAMMQEENAMTKPAGEMMTNTATTSEGTMMDTATDTMMQKPDGTR